MFLVWLLFAIDMLVTLAIGHVLFFDLGAGNPFSEDLTSWWIAFGASIAIAATGLALARTGRVAAGLLVLALVALPGLSLLPVQGLIAWEALRPR